MLLVLCTLSLLKTQALLALFGANIFSSEGLRIQNIYKTSQLPK